MNKLQKALKINALFSSISGIIMILLNQPIAKLFGTSNSTVFWIVGLILVYFAITIWYEINKQRKLAVIWIIIQDYTWVVGSLILVIFNPFKITLTGNLIIGIIALIVLYMGINQTIGLKKR
ncbi:MULTISPECIES: hypothetical protein [Algibacter]|uniref:Integral membrane protein n=1 Tax=Algibacter lectus TaxID=221126 RepID=A0A4V3HHK1_9FLAO|nr:hypothetical protein [Algibacter lectus]MWW26730.1 hypothetical protein [Algibacter lectus]TDY65468.1 hypothetical protein DFQ06_0071 [Algibacter lectus]SFD65252.1 hypothetical protein SAMN04489722_11477 [Algibacter lectus]